MKERKTEIYSTIIIIYCILAFFCGIVHVNTVLWDDINHSQLKTGRVSLGISYWYELYSPRKLFKWYSENKEIAQQPIYFLYYDKAASPLYARLYGIRMARSPESGNLISAYLEYNNAYTRLNRSPQWQNIYQLKVKTK